MKTFHLKHHRAFVIGLIGFVISLNAKSDETVLVTELGQEENYQKVKATLHDPKTQAKIKQYKELCNLAKQSPNPMSGKAREICFNKLPELERAIFQGNAKAEEDIESLRRATQSSTTLPVQKGATSRESIEREQDSPIIQGKPPEAEALSLLSPRREKAAPDLDGPDFAPDTLQDKTPPLFQIGSVYDSPRLRSGSLQGHSGINDPIHETDVFLAGVDRVDPKFTSDIRKDMESMVDVDSAVKERVQVDKRKNSSSWFTRARIKKEDFDAALAAKKDEVIGILDPVSKPLAAVKERALQKLGLGPEPYSHVELRDLVPVANQELRDLLIQKAALQTAKTGAAIADVAGAHGASAISAAAADPFIAYLDARIAAHVKKLTNAESADLHIAGKRVTANRERFGAIDKAHAARDIAQPELDHFGVTDSIEAWKVEQIDALKEKFPRGIPREQIQQINQKAAELLDKVKGPILEQAKSVDVFNRAADAIMSGTPGLAIFKNANELRQTLAELAKSPARFSDASLEFHKMSLRMKALSGDIAQKLTHGKTIINKLENEINELRRIEILSDSQTERLSKLVSRKEKLTNEMKSMEKLKAEADKNYEIRLEEMLKQSRVELVHYHEKAETTLSGYTKSLDKFTSNLMSKDFPNKAHAKQVLKELEGKVAKRRTDFEIEMRSLTEALKRAKDLKKKGLSPYKANGSAPAPDVSHDDIIRGLEEDIAARKAIHANDLYQDKKFALSQILQKFYGNSPTPDQLKVVEFLQRPHQYSAIDVPLNLKKFPAYPDFSSIRLHLGRENEVIQHLEQVLSPKLSLFRSKTSNEAASIAMSQKLTAKLTEFDKNPLEPLSIPYHQPRVVREIALGSNSKPTIEIKGQPDGDADIPAFEIIDDPEGVRRLPSNYYGRRDRSAVKPYSIPQPPKSEPGPIQKLLNLWNNWRKPAQESRPPLVPVPPPKEVGAAF